MFTLLVLCIRMRSGLSCVFLFFRQKTAYDVRISDWSSDVCSSDLGPPVFRSISMAAQYSFVMKGLSKTYPGAQKPTLNNINLQFYPDAKIGIVGPNGTGKSTLMKVMAGIYKDFTGEAWPGEGITVGYLAQEPTLDPPQTVQEKVKAGMRS